MAGRPSAKDKAQSAHFIEAAPRMETDDSPEEFERVFGKVIAQKAGDVAVKADLPPRPSGEDD